MNIPDELFLEIIFWMDENTLIALSSTCKRYRWVIDEIGTILSKKRGYVLSVYATYCYVQMEFYRTTDVKKSFKWARRYLFSLLSLPKSRWDTHKYIYLIDLEDFLESPLHFDVMEDDWLNIWLDWEDEGNRLCKMAKFVQKKIEYKHNIVL